MLWIVITESSKEIRKNWFEVSAYLIENNYRKDFWDIWWYISLSNGSDFLKRVPTSAKLSSSGNMSFLIELFMLTVNICKHVLTESIKTFTGTMTNFFLLKDFIISFHFIGWNLFKTKFCPKFFLKSLDCSNGLLNQVLNFAGKLFWGSKIL